MDALLKMNQSPEYKGGPACASHEFCDPNLFMDSAFVFVMGRERDAASQEDADLINEAWTFARRIGAI